MRSAAVRWTKMFWLVLTLVFLGTCLSLPAYAAEGDGSGGGSDDPLQMVSSSPADGQKDVALPLPAITLSFSKNVINATVRDNNQRCFSLYAHGNQRVPIRVDMADDQIQPEKKRDVSLIPLTELQPGATYTVKVAPELQSKSGAVLGRELSITFSTAGEPEEVTVPAGGTASGGSGPSGGPAPSAGSRPSGGFGPDDEKTAGNSTPPPAVNTEGPPAAPADTQGEPLPASQPAAVDPTPRGTPLVPVALVVFAALVIAIVTFIRGRNRKVDS